MHFHSFILFSLFPTHLSSHFHESSSISPTVTLNIRGCSSISPSTSDHGPIYPMFSFAMCSRLFCVPFAPCFHVVIALLAVWLVADRL